MAERTKRRRRRRRTGSKKAFLVLLALVLLVLGGVKLRYALAHRNLPGSNVSAPDFVTVDYLPANEYSRPGTPLEEISGVVIHYVGNPGTSAAANRSFLFDRAKVDQASAWAASSRIVILHLAMTDWPRSISATYSPTSLRALSSENWPRSILTPRCASMAARRSVTLTAP